jgi:hypothetical protein
MVYTRSAVLHSVRSRLSSNRRASGPFDFSQDDPQSPAYNVPERVDAFVAAAMEWAALYRGSDVLMLMGSDFQVCWCECYACLRPESWCLDIMSCAWFFAARLSS